jgi:hypothetical protein
MQLSLVGLLFVGLDRGSLGIVVNAAIALGVTYLPAVLERDYAIPMDPALTLWLTSAVFLHALGTVGLPLAGTGGSFYRNVWWWDHLTHTLSSSVVGAAGYATIRALEVHTETVHFPGKFVAVFLLLFVVAFGVFWEVIEFAISGAASMLGGESVLTQYGLSDTMLDLLFDVVGGVIVALWGTAYLSDVVGALAALLDGS